MVARTRLAAPKRERQEWPWHSDKTAVVAASLLFKGDRRMEAESYLDSGFGTRMALESKSSGWCYLGEVARVWQPSRLKGIQVGKEYGTPFLAATQVYDVRPVPRKWLSPERTNNIRDRFVTPGTILLTCSGSVGRATLAHSTTSGVIVSHDLLRIEVKEKDWWGWVYACLRAPTVRSMMSSSKYGHIIKHLEVSHLDTLPTLRLNSDLRAEFGKWAQKLLQLRDRAYDLVLEAETLLSNIVGVVKDEHNSSNGFTIQASEMFSYGRRLEAFRYNPAACRAEAIVRGSAKRVERLGELVKSIFVPGRFKHIYGPDGVPYLDSAQLLEISPEIEKRVLSLRGEKQAGYIVDRGTLLIPCSGQLHGIIGSAILASEWHENKVITNHVLRIVPKSNPTIRIGYLQAVLSHPTLGRPRVIKSAFGSSVPELGPDEISRLRIPRIDVKHEERIADCMEEAAILRSEADRIEDEISQEAERYVAAYLKGEMSHCEG